MKIIFMLSHPAQYHFAKNIIQELKKDGNDVLVAMKSKDVLENLLKENGVEYVNIQPSVRKNNKVSMLMASLKRTSALMRQAKRFGADILVGTDSSVAQVAFLLNKVSFTTLEDDAEIIPRLAKLTFPFSTEIVVPDCCSVGKWTAKKVGYSGYMKLAYLHPKRFAPDCEIVKKYGIDPSRPYFIIRLVSLSAHHDNGINGLNTEVIQKMVNLMSEKGTVYISSERPLEPQFEKYRLHINPLDIHHILAFSTLFIGDSQSMAVESAMLGVPNIRFNDFVGKKNISVLEELEYKYRLTEGISSSEPDKLFERVNDLLSSETFKEDYKSRRSAMLSDKIDVSAFLTWFIENYPESRRIMKENPEFQYNFK